MKEYNITMPIAGAVRATVKAASKSEAIESAYEKACEFLQSWTIDESESEVVELEAYESTGEGNVTNLNYNHVEVDEA